ncbi:spg20 protein [Zymoseptoria brevis]|uniref:Spg20 protein n=1 Tax=Zymoseptoria brevis TaxID=1047168 RepID=A0A0F4GA06_9PEZI|nr:spg20 protein [Zymoseptoria brevis]
MAGHNDPKLLYSIKGIKAYHIQDGEEHDLTPSGPQTLSLLMVPTSSPFADLSTTIPQNEIPDEDFYLHLNLPPELELPLPATTQVYHQPPTSYLIPRWDLGHGSGAFTRIEFPRIGYGVTQDDVDTFETILAQCTAFLERAKPPMSSRPGEKSSYNPSDYAAGGQYRDEKSSHQHGEIVLVDEDNGSVVGELGQGTQVVESSTLKPGSKEPVELELSPDGKHISVRPVSEDYLRMARHPAYKDSSIVQNAATASRLLVTTTSSLGNMLVSRADSFTKTSKPAAKPMEFAPSTHERVRKINTFTTSVAGVSNKTVGQLSDTVQNFAARAAGKKKERPHKGFDEQGNPLDKNDYKPGFLNKSLIAFSTVMDGIATSGKTLLETSGSAASTVVGHKYGDEAGTITRNLAGGVKNVGLVYIDVTGVSRRAVIKSVAKGMVIGKVRGGGEVVVGGGDGGVVTAEDLKGGDEKPSGSGSSSVQGGFKPSTEPYHPVGFGAGAPPKYQEFGQPGAYPREKHG